jgi:hypothetical protein
MDGPKKSLPEDHLSEKSPVLITWAEVPIDAILEIVSDEAELIVYGPAQLPFTGQFRGQSGTRQFLEALTTTQDEITRRNQRTNRSR